MSASRDQSTFEQQLVELMALLDERIVLRRGVAAFAAAGEVDVAWVGELGARGDLRIEHVRSARTHVLNGLSVPKGWGLTGKTFTSGRLDAVDDYFAARSITHHFDAQISAEGVLRLVAAPVFVDGRVVAVLAGGSRSPGSFGGVQMEQFEQVASRTSIALQAATRSRQLTQAAVHEDRQRMAAALHDNVGALLFAIQASVRELAEALGDDRGLRRQAERIEARAAEAADALRASLTMMQVAPPRIVLEAELRGDAEAFQQRSGVRASLIILQADALVLSGTRAQVLVRAVREALLNVEKHAGASSVVITVARRGNLVIATVTDDGRGHELDADASFGLGLTEMRRQFARLGGQVDISYPEEGGAVLRACLPL